MMTQKRHAVFLALAFLALGACESTGSVTFGYVILTQDPNDPRFAENGQDGTDTSTFQALDCAQVGAAFIEVSLFAQRAGEAAPFIEATRQPCNSLNTGDPLLTSDEFGVFFGNFLRGRYLGFSIKLLDEAGDTLAIRPLEENASRLGQFGDLIFFEAPVEIFLGDIIDLDFAGAGQFGVDLDGDGVADANELQIFVPFVGQ